MRAQSISINNQVRYFLGKERFVRIDPKVPAKEVSLDRHSDIDDLIGRAAHHSRIHMTEIEPLCAHVAAPYKPYHAMEAACSP